MSIAVFIVQSAIFNRNLQQKKAWVYKKPRSIVYGIPELYYCIKWKDLCCMFESMLTMNKQEKKTDCYKMKRFVLYVWTDANYEWAKNKKNKNKKIQQKKPRS